MKNKILIIFLFTILLSTFVFSDPVVKINDNLTTYTNSDSENFYVEVSNTGDDCEVESDFISINLSSDATSSFPFLIYCNLERNYSGYFSVDFSTNTPTPPIPNVLVNDEDIVVADYNGFTANLVVDTINTVTGTFDFNAVDSFVDYYYKGDVQVTSLDSFSDAHSGLKEYYIYIVDVDSVNDYRDDYYKRLIVDVNETSIDLGTSTTVSDGNYFVLVEALDYSGNLATSSQVILNKKNMYVDNTAPQVTSFSLGTFSEGITYYVPSTTTTLTLLIEDDGVGVRNEPLYTQIDRDSVKLADYNATLGGFFFDFTTVDYDIDGSYELAATDLLGNLNEKEFSIMIDETSPTTPTVSTVTRAVDNNVTISNWGTSTDSGSGLKEYKVYRSTSSFTEISNQDLICTVSAAASKTCLDSTSKSDDTRYYYGVTAIDNAGNNSSVVTASIKTGPELDVDIDLEDSDFVNTVTPEINLEYGSDVNAVRFSCNASTFTSWVEVSGTSEVYDSFNITSGNGCNTDQGDKIIYVEARSEDDPYLITRESFEFELDSKAPTIPSNIEVLEQANGSLKLSWTSSTDVNGSGLEEYRIYYSESESVSKSSQYMTSSDEEYIFNPNEDKTFYFKISAIDEALNESDLSSIASGTAKRFGPSFTFNASPKNLIDDVYYLKKGNVLFTITSSEELKQTPIIRLKVGSLPYKSISASYSNLITTFNYSLEESGDSVLEITGTNNSNETTTDTFNFIVDAEVPTFTADYNFFEETKLYEFKISDFSEDVFRAQYLLNNVEEVCFIEDSNNDYLCSLDSTLYEDGNHKMYVLVYDQALNYETEIISFEIDNVDEALVLKESLVAEINSNILTIEDRISFLQAISLDVSQELLDKFSDAKDKVVLAKSLEDSNNFSEAVNTYTSSNNSLLEILEVLPKENILKTKTIEIDLLNNSFDLNTVILDQNILTDNLSFYDVNNQDLNFISVSREFSVFEVSGQNFYSSNLIFVNDANEDKIISFIEVIPKEFEKSSDNIYFDRNIVVIDKDPIILYNLVIPKNSSLTTKYISQTPITSFDILTKFDAIVYSSPLLLTGSVNLEDLNFEKPLIDSKSLFMVAVVLLVIIILLLVIWMVASGRKKKEDVFKEMEPKDAMNKYLGNKLDNNTSEKNVDEKEEEHKSDLEKKKKYDSNYEFILDAVKRSNK